MIHIFLAIGLFMILASTFFIGILYARISGIRKEKPHIMPAGVVSFLVIILFLHIFSFISLLIFSVFPEFFLKLL